MGVEDRNILDNMKGQRTVLLQSKMTGSSWAMERLK